MGFQHSDGNEEEYAEDLDFDFGIDDLYGSYDDNMKAIKTHFGSY